MVRGLLVSSSVLLFVGVVRAQQFPLLDAAADRVIKRYREATCEQLWEKRGKPKSDEEKNVIQLMRDDPQMRTAFMNKIAAPVANKLFECGMIP